MKKERIAIDILEIAVTFAVIEQFHSLKRMIKETHNRVIDIQEEVEYLHYMKGY